jgi:hypothetical protein
MMGRVLALLAMPWLVAAAGVVKEYQFGAPRVSGENVTLPGCRPAFIPFAPDVPVKPVILLLPRGQKAVSYTVKYGPSIEVPGTYYVRPFRPDGRLSAKPPADYLLRKASAYLQNRYFPGTVPSGSFTMQYVSGLPVFIAKVNPVQYNPATGRLKYHTSITVTVETAAGVAPVYKSNAWVRGTVAAWVDNPEAAAKLADSPVSADDYEYLVVTTNALKNCFGAFIDFNRRRCLRTKVAAKEDIRAHTTGIDDQEKIRNYIRQEYTERNITYVLLAGDAWPGAANLIPHRGMRAAACDYGDTVNAADFYDEHDIPADMYYSCLDSTWQNPGSHYYGEHGSEDLTWEVYAARFPAGDSAGLSNMIRKTINYSEHPVTGHGVRNVLLAGEKLWGTWDGHPVDCYGDFEMEQFVGNCIANNYSTMGFPAQWTFTRLYEKTNEWSGMDFISSLKNGKITWVDHEGHANQWYCFKMYASAVTADNFPQDGISANYFFAYSGGCYAGSFDNRDEYGNYSSADCFGEDLVKLPTGAVAVLFNSRYGFADDGSNGTSGTDGSNQRLRRYFHDAIFSKGIHYVEMMNAYSKEVNADIILDPDIHKVPYYGQLKWCAYETNILGDPALSLWTETPAVLTPSLPALLTAARFSMNTPPYSWVALADAGGTILCTQLTDSTGNCFFQNKALSAYMEANPQGRLKVLIKAHNYYPYSGEVRLDVPVIGSGSGREPSVFNVALVRMANGYALKYRLPASGSVRVELFDSRGAIVRRAVNKVQTAGPHEVVFDDASLHSGIYHYRIIAGKQRQAGKFIAVK